MILPPDVAEVVIERAGRYDVGSEPVQERPSAGFVTPLGTSASRDEPSTLPRSCAPTTFNLRLVAVVVVCILASAARADTLVDLAATDRAIAASPRSTALHMRRATILLSVGAGAAARREALLLTKQEPKNALAFITLGRVLTSDLLVEQKFLGTRAVYYVARIGDHLTSSDYIQR